MMLGPSQTNPAARRGFTLNELLIVVAIIAVLVALSAAGYFSLVGTQQKRNTEATITTVHQTLQKHWSQIVSEARKEPVPPQVRALANGENERAQVLWVKIRLMEAFPISFAEINDSTHPTRQFLNTMIPAGKRKNLATYQRATGGMAAASDPLTESAACLLMALSIKRAGVSLNADELGPAVTDTDGDGINELIDGWQQPLFFYRFAWNRAEGDPPIQNYNPATAGKGLKLADPLDPDGRLFAWSSPNRTTYFEPLFHPIALPDDASRACYVIPAIVSMGGDGELGLYLPTECAANGLSLRSDDTEAFYKARDNLYSFVIAGN